jgi:NADPH2:quinone reductase
MMRVAVLALLWVSKAAVPSTMKAGALTKKPWDMKVHLADIKEVQVSVPVPKSGQVLIEVHGSSVNPVDWKLIESPYSLSWSYPHVFGRDFAGKVVAVGEDVTHLKVGDSVWGDNSQNEGSYAEYVAVDQSIVGMAPSQISLAEAGTLPLVALTGLEAFHFAQAPWQSGKIVVVLGGSGGTGHTGIQLAKALGASEVIATCGTPHVDFCKSQGADQVIDYHKTDWQDVIAPKSVDVVYDTVAIRGTGDLAFDVLKDEGFFVTLLPDALASKATASKRPSIKQENFMLSQIQTSYLDTLKTFADAGKLRGHIDKTFSISEIAAAFNESMGGHTTGKVSVVPRTTPLVV